MRFLCRIGWHDWTKWRAGHIPRTDGSYIHLQERVCVCCGKIERSRL